MKPRKNKTKGGFFGIFTSKPTADSIQKKIDELNKEKEKIEKKITELNTQKLALEPSKSIIKTNSLSTPTAP